MNNHPKITIKKLEAAERQLNCAIDLWFNGGDEVSIHTLAAAAYQITHDIKKHRNIDHGLLYDSDMVKDEHRKEWINVMKGAQNFFKHADKDPEGTVELSTFGNLVFLLMGSAGLALLGVKPNAHTHALFLWLVLHEPRLIRREYLEKFTKAPGLDDLEDVRAIPKPAFFENYLRQYPKLVPKGGG